MDTIERCHAKSKQSGNRCCNFAVRGRRVCHIHGGKTPIHNIGPKTESGKLKQKMASKRHGMCSEEAKAERQAFRDMVKKYKN